MDNEPAAPAQPQLLAMVICDGVHRGPGSDKLYLLGTFDQMNAAGVPVAHPVIFVYLVLTEVYGKAKVRMQLIDINEEREPLGIADIEVNCPSPRMACELVFGFQNVVFPAFGEYCFQASIGGDVFAERRFLLAQTGGEVHHDD